MTREEKLFALTKYELAFLIESPDWLEDASKFFSEGGFSIYTDEQLNQQYKNLLEEV